MSVNGKHTVYTLALCNSQLIHSFTNIIQIKMQVMLKHKM
jgi:hypothetical protein